MQNLNNKNKLYDLLAHGATVITPNNRLSAALLQHFFVYCNKQTVDKPHCFPYNTLLSNTYQQLKLLKPEQPHPILLNPAQCQHLWRTILRADQQITYSEGLLNSVMQAWEYCLLWQISSTDQEFNYTPQTKQFQNWWQHFEKQLQSQNYICEQQLVSYLINTEQALFTQPVIWVCFDDFNPQQLSFQNYLMEQGVEQYRYDLIERATTPVVLEAADDKEEYEQLMAWLQSKINNGDQRIGVVVPDLQQESRALHRLLQRHFDPALFNISLGQALSEFPLVAHALLWLSIDTERLHHSQASLLLQSPYIGSAKEEFMARSQYLQDSSLLNDQNIAFKTLVLELSNSAPQLAELLRQIQPYPPQASVLEWINHFQNRLNLMGFPGDYGLSSTNYQCMNRFSSVFDEFRQLSLLSTTLSAKEALDAFTHLLNNTIFQAQKTSAPIQISGLLEASGCEFDSLWVKGLTDQCLPQKTRLSAFIPPHIQRERAMPHSLPLRELQFAQQTLQRLNRGSPVTVFSYAHLQGDNPNLPCALISDFPKMHHLPISISTRNQLSLVAMEDAYSLAITSNETVSGGTALLANQAKCPFKAFAEHRLRAKPSPQICDGIDAREKGQVLHKIMELIWSRIKSQQELMNNSAEELDQLINQAINTALTPIQQLHPEVFVPLVQDIEYLRLKRLVLASLEWEKQRPDFSIAAIEQSYAINLAGLDFKVRVDRLDQVGDKKWLIDYKSTLPTSKPWNEDRPKEPQLLLYTLLDEQINTLLLMQLKAGKINCSGFSEEKHDITGITAVKKDSSWKDYRETWQQQLTLLAEEFQQGHCPPQPLNASICQQCDFKNLCRFQISEHN